MTLIKFGTDGWRAIIGQDYTYENVRKVIQAFCDLHVKDVENPFVYLGYDRRFSSDLFAKEAAGVLAANGIRVRLSNDFCPTPCISWMTKEKKALAGIMITASHNPYQWNGVKFKEPYGGSASPEYCQAIEKQIVANDQAQKKVAFISFEEALAQNWIEFFDPHQEYVQQLRRMVDVDLIRKAKLKIACDPIYGAGSHYFSSVLDQEVIAIRSDANPGFGGVNPEPIEKNLEVLLQTVRTQKCHIGLATDGDADRIGAVDDLGRFVDSHKIFSLILRHLITHKKSKGEVVTTVSTTQMVTRLCQKYDLKMHETPIGFKYICQKFLQIHPLMGGEESGGIAVAEHVYERDGVLSGLLLLEIIALHQKPLSEIISDLQKEAGPLEFVRRDLQVSEEKIRLLKERLQNNPPQLLLNEKITRSNLLDGFKYFLEDDSWLLVRPSGTEPLLRLYAEAPTLQKAEAMIQEGYRWVEA
ncbi:MAG: phosphoglucomutase/phosphomannomutase family protein [Deltaproteobacteria bacterium]|nr:phosphoglucomutase/phosphomannomutase family protein [Deltaproteobacteria bacterium]